MQRAVCVTWRASPYLNNGRASTCLLPVPPARSWASTDRAHRLVTSRAAAATVMLPQHSHSSVTLDNCDTCLALGHGLLGSVVFCVQKVSQDQIEETVRSEKVNARSEIMHSTWLCYQIMLSVLMLLFDAHNICQLFCSTGWLCSVWFNTTGYCISRDMSHVQLLALLVIDLCEYCERALELDRLLWNLVC